MFLIAQSGEQCPYRPRFVGSWNLRVEPIRIFKQSLQIEFSETHTPLRKPLTQAVGLLARKPRCVGDKQRWSWSGYEF